jgi:hypothetical protein
MPHISHTGKCKPFTSKPCAFAKQNHPPGKARTSNPEIRRLASDRSHVHSYHQNLEKLSTPLFSSNQSDLVIPVKNSVRISLEKFGYLSLTVRKRRLSDILNFLALLWKNGTYCPLLGECYVSSIHVSISANWTGAWIPSILQPARHVFKFT